MILNYFSISVYCKKSKSNNSDCCMLNNFFIEASRSLPYYETAQSFFQDLWVLFFKFSNCTSRLKYVRAIFLEKGMQLNRPKSCVVLSILTWFILAHIASLPLFLPLLHPLTISSPHTALPEIVKRDKIKF